jgi:cobalt-zinc-cadmium efflux system membrane fusion protein
MANMFPSLGKISLRSQAVVGAVVIAIAIAIVLQLSRSSRGNTPPEAAEKPASSSSARIASEGRFHPTDRQWATLTVEPVVQHQFRTEVVTEGKIAVDEDRVTRVFSPYAGRVAKILAHVGDMAQQGQPLFVIEAADSVQAQNDFIAAVAALNKARARVKLTGIGEQRSGTLFKDKAGSLKDWQEAQTNLTAAQNDLRSAEIALQAVLSRLRLLGKTDAEIENFEKTGTITPDSTVYSPISGTILQRKAGPGQFIDAGASGGDPVFLIGDISKVWLVAYVRETDAAKAKRGETVRFTVLADPSKSFEGKVDFVASAIDPASRRLMVRANIDNAEGLLKSEMFARVSLAVDESGPTTAVPREAVIYEGNLARVWVAHDDHTIELRQVKLGLSGDDLVQVVDGLAPGEKVVTRGSLFIDRMASRQS